MAGGDLLYIFAFIILPTAVLVSCIWALLLLRKGVLLPGRPATMRDTSYAMTTEDEVTAGGADLVEETGEHTVVEPAPTATAPVAPMTVAGDPETSTPESGEPPEVQAPVIEPPATEQTQELTVLPVEVADASDTRRDPETATDEPLETGEPAAMPDTRGEAAQSAAAAPDAASGVVIVPLDEPSHVSPTSSRAEKRDTAPTAPPPTPGVTDAIPDTSDADGDQPDQSPSALTSARRPARRITHLRTAEEATARPRPRASQRRSPRQPDGEA